jgi:hypothetical protein
MKENLTFKKVSYKSQWIQKITARRSRNQKPLATEGTETTEPKIKSSKQKGSQNPHSSLSPVYGGGGRVRGSE